MSVGPDTGPLRETVAEKLAPMARRLDIVTGLEPYRAQCWSGALAEAPALQIDDFTAIPFLDVPGAEKYQHRARLRARPGDLFAAVTPGSSAYETYCRDHLLLGDAEMLEPEPAAGRFAVARACRQGAVFSRLVERAREAGGLTVHPYMGIQDAWDLASEISRDASAPVEVLGPPPPVMWVANDKDLLSETVERLLGAEFLVETQRHDDIAGIAGGLRDLASRHAQVGLKRLRCASANGNLVFAAGTVLTTEPGQLERTVTEFLERTEWDGYETVLSVAWEATELSPSTQLWIPRPDDGPVRLDGIYEQILEGTEGTFVGSRPSRLPEAVERTLAETAIRVATGFQQLGYVGRCSFDHLVLGDPQGDFRTVFTECNGRWGGTSTPMALIDRLVEKPRPVYRAQDFAHPGLRGADFADVLDATCEHLFRPENGTGTFVFYNVGPLAEHGKLDVIAIAGSPDEADEAVLESLPRLLGL